LSDSSSQFGVFSSSATAELTGNIESPRIAIDEGAIFEGQVRMKRTPAAAPPAPVVAAAPPAPVAVGAPPPPPAPAAPMPREIPTLPAIGKRKLIRRDA
jgi:hypothetical protein